MITTSVADNRLQIRLHSGIYYLEHDTVNKIIHDPDHSFGRIIVDLVNQEAPEMDNENIARVTCYSIIDCVTAEYN